MLRCAFKNLHSPAVELLALDWRHSAHSPADIARQIRKRLLGAAFHPLNGVLAVRLSQSIDSFNQDTGIEMLLHGFFSLRRAPACTVICVKKMQVSFRSIKDYFR